MNHIIHWNQFLSGTQFLHCNPLLMMYFTLILILVQLLVLAITISCNYSHRASIPLCTLFCHSFYDPETFVTNEPSKNGSSFQQVYLQLIGYSILPVYGLNSFLTLRVFSSLRYDCFNCVAAATVFRIGVFCCFLQGLQANHVRPYESCFIARVFFRPIPLCKPQG